MPQAGVIPGTAGYAAQAAALVDQYEAIDPEHKHRAVLHLFPPAPSRVLDIGAGTGADAAWFAARGHSVVAVEPVAELREPGRALHRDADVEWVDDGLPDLARLHHPPFDLVLLTAVWMHLDAAERHAAMPRVVAQLAPGGRLVFSLRHGPVPAGRRMFEVGADETLQLAHDAGLHVLLNVRTPSTQAHNQAAGIEWTRLVFERPR
ncbi:MAG: class I SAM-dependent methyltransferase [Rhizobacter sp.]